jgi:hypothetical protein
MNHTHFKNASELLREFTTFSMRDPQKAAEMFAEEGAFEMPYLADFGFPPRYAGRAEIGSFFKMVRELYPGFEFENIVIHMATPEQVFAEYEFTAESSVTKRNIHQHFFGWLVAKDGKIKLLREALNAAALAQAIYSQAIPQLPATT